MRAATRMMMLTSLGDNERDANYERQEENQNYRGNQNRTRQGRPESGMEDGYRSAYEMEYGGGQNEMRGGYEGRRGSRMSMEEPMNRRQYAGARRRGGMYSGRDNPMGFDMSGSEEEGGGADEWSGRFRGISSDHEPETHGQHEPKEERLKRWVKGMQNADGTMGEHFKQDQTELMRANHCPGCDKAEYYAAVNMMYSDYCEVAKRMGVDSSDFYGHMAKAFLMDKDAGEGKLAKYMKYVAGK